MKNVKCSTLFTNMVHARTLPLYRLLRIFGLAAATMLLAILLHLLIFHLLTASDAPPRDLKDTQSKTRHTKDSEYRVTHIDTCPDVGFFFQREVSANSLTPDACFLCFCQGDHTAVCWKRDNRRCNTESFHYHGVGKRDKRSPGFTDIFFRDASRDYFNKNTKTQCKPYESSFSDDCPPADWCTGCTVCDCDANGRWDCHLLSFCPDNKKKTSKGNWPPPNIPLLTPEFRKSLKEKKYEKINKSSSISADKRRSMPNKNYKIPKKFDNKAKPQKQRAKPQTKREDKKKPPPPRHVIQKSVPLKPSMKPDPRKMKTPIKYRKVAPKTKNSTKKMIIKKDIATRKPIQINKSNKVSLEVELAHKLMKRVMQSLKKTVAASVKKMSEMVKQNSENVRDMKAKAKLRQEKKKPKSVSKRQIKKPNVKPPYKKKKVPMKKPIYRARGKPASKTGIKTYIRHKRDVTMPGNIGIPANVTHGSSAESTNTTVPLTVIPVTSIPVTSIPVTSIPVISIPVTSIPVTSIPVTSIPVNSIPVTSIPLTSIPVTSIPVTSIPVTSIPVTSIPVTSIPVTSILVTSSSPVPVRQKLPSSDGNFTHALVGSNTLQDNKYYKYTVGSEEPRTKLDVSIGDTTTTQFNITETVFNLLGANLTSIVNTEKRHVKNNEQNKSINSKEINPEKNGLKFSKWINLKILKEKKISSESDIKDKRLMKLMPHTNKTIHLDYKNRNHGKKVERKLNYRKKNMVKLLNLSKCKFDNCKIKNSINIHMLNKNKGDVQGYVPKIINNHHKKSTTDPPKRKRKLGVLKYLKRIFNNIFKGKRMPDKMSKHKLIKTLCENFGPCLKVNRKDRVLLNSKLSDLDRETTRILKTVKIIKGLLKLLVLPESVNSNFSTSEHFRNDMQKLNKIVKGIFSKNGQVKLTATQLTQIEYIKRSIQDFIQSVSRFALLLNEIVAILTKQDMNSYRNKAKKDFVNKNLSKDDSFQSLKNLLLRYNLVQNTFMKKMYDQLHTFEYKINEKSKVSESKDLNNSVTIENISRNIIHNLRKLKHLAQTGSYSGRERVRTKRSTGRDDDTVEYLLLLMEYLIKQNHPLDVEPVNDGIDLLIEAIKNAPDIKPIKKKVLEYTPAIYLDTTTTTTSPRISSTATSEDTKSEDDSPSESDKTFSSEDSSKTKLEENENKLKETKGFVGIVADDEKDFEDKFQFDRKAEPDKTDEITELAFFRKLGEEDNIMVEPENVFEATTAINSIIPLEMETSDKLDSRDDLNLEKTLAIESNILDKPTEYSEAGKKNIEVFTGDMDEESFLQSTVATESDVPTIITTEFLSQAFHDQKSKAKIKYQKFQSYDNDSGDKRSKLKWIEENFGKETEKGFVDFEENNSTLGITPVTTKTITAKTLDKIDVSGLTKEKYEVSERYGKKETGKKTAAKLSAEEVMFRKQMELLNSLDYGTERAEVYESDSKDSNVEERYTGDSFPAYFV